MEGFDHVGTGDVEDFVAAFEIRAAEVVNGEALRLKPGSGCTVENEDMLSECVDVVGHSGTLFRLEHSDTSSLPPRERREERRDEAERGHVSLWVRDERDDSVYREVHVL